MGLILSDMKTRTVSKLTLLTKAHVVAATWAFSILELVNSLLIFLAKILIARTVVAQHLTCGRNRILPQMEV